MQATPGLQISMRKWNIFDKISLFLHQKRTLSGAMDTFEITQSEHKSQTCVKWTPNNECFKVFKTDHHLMQNKSNAESS